MTLARISAGIIFVTAACFAACGDDGGKQGSGAGGSGGTTASGGSASGGTTSSGGSRTGGTTSTGGSSATGGKGSGGASSGGTTASGGASGGSAGGSQTGGSGGAGASGSTSAGGGNGGSGGTAGRGGSSGGTTAAGGTTGPGGTINNGGTNAGGSTSSGGASGTGGNTGGLPPLKVNGTKLQDPNGKTIVLRGSSLIDIGALYAYNGNSVKGITDRMDKLAAAGVQGHVVRFPVYPKIDYNGGYPYCSDLPYPVGTGPGTSCTAKSPMSAADYVSKVLTPAIDYATSKKLYVIIDHHQIDDATTGTSAADAKTFWTDIAPRFASYGNVLYEVFNEPIDGQKTWAQLKPAMQSLVDAIRNAGADNVIIVPSNSYCQRPGDAASDPPSDPKSNLMYTAHVYPGNWNDNFKKQVATAVSKAPVFFTEWGYVFNGSDQNLGTSNASWGSDFRSTVDANGGSWTAWVTDNGWTPNMFSDSALTKLTEFGTLTKDWLAAKANSDWVE